jgi:uncharacterized protein with GYD domain
MATFIMLGQYTTESVKNISAKRSVDAEALIKKHGGKVKEGYAMLGKNDLLLIVEAKNVESAMKISVGLSKLLDISFTTSPAVGMDDFDNLMKDV